MDWLDKRGLLFSKLLNQELCNTHLIGSFSILIIGFQKEETMWVSFIYCTFNNIFVLFIRHPINSHDFEYIQASFY